MRSPYIVEKARTCTNMLDLILKLKTEEIYRPSTLSFKCCQLELTNLNDADTIPFIPAILPEFFYCIKTYDSYCKNDIPMISEPFEFSEDKVKLKETKHFETFIRREFA
jgi:hypothetical protein